MPPDTARWRIGELSRRVGVSSDVLRAWERRYRLLQPARTPGGFRLYGPADEQRVVLMQAHLADGLRPAQAALATLTAVPAPAAATPERFADDAPAVGTMTLHEEARALAAALDSFDEPGAQASFDRLLAGWTIDSVLRDVLVPYLRRLGERWERHEVTVAQEHFASHVLRARLGSLSRGWGQGRGHLALLACPPGELHDLPLMMFGIALHRQGWRIRYLGQDVPLADLSQAAAVVEPAIIVLAATVPEHFSAHVRDLAELAATVPLVIAGNGATADLAEAIGARHLPLDPVTAAQRL